MSIDLIRALTIAKQAATAAAETIEQFQLANTQIEIKADTSPVTAADRAAERAIRQHLQAHFPEHSIWGEEYGNNQSSSSTKDDYLWLIDPIDGTKSWIAGLPFWSIQIALWHCGEVILGVSHAPAFNEMAYSIKSDLKARTTWFDEKPVSTSNIIELQDMRLSSGNLASLADDERRWQTYGNIVKHCNRGRGYGDYYHYHRLAAGQLDAVIESDVNILDIAALWLLVENAGGVITDLEGKALTLETTSVLAAATPALHTKLECLFND